MVARFYGWTDREVGSLECSRYNDYLLSIEPLKARETMLNMRVAVYPEMKKEDRRKFFDEIKSKLNSNLKKVKSAPKTTREIAMKLSGQKNG